MTKSFGDLVLFENISLGLSEGQRVGLIAKNGSGKTTLLNILSGKEGYDNGTISFRRDLRVGYLEQDPQYPEELTVLEACFHHGNSTVELIKEYERCMETEGHPGLDEILVRMDHEKAWEYEQKAKQILSQLKIRDFSQHVKHLSGGQLKRVALANTLITEPDLLILDEPTNHLDLDMTEWLEEYLRRNNLSLLMVTHDRYFLDDVVDRIFAFEGNGKLTQYEGGYTDYAEAKARKYGAGSSEIGAGAGSSLSDKAASGNNSTEDEEKKPTRKDWKQGQKSEKLKFTYKEEREYAVIDEDIARLEEKIARLENDMMANATNSVKLREIMADKEAAEKQLEEKMDRWVYLNDLAEQIEAQKNNG